jgi:hypothetical protein
MGSGDPGNETEAESETFLRTWIGGVNAVEAVKDMGEMFLTDAFARVLDRQVNEPIAAS